MTVDTHDPLYAVMVQNRWWLVRAFLLDNDTFSTLLHMNDNILLLSTAMTIQIQKGR